MSSHGGAVSEGVPEGPGAARCEVCDREPLRELLLHRFMTDLYLRGEDALEAKGKCFGDKDCYKRGFERMRAERDSFLAKKRDATAAATEISAERNHLRARLVEVERERDEARKAREWAYDENKKHAERALQAEGAARTLREALREAREHLIGRALCDDDCETLRMVDLALSGLPPLADAPRVAPTTPAALVPKDTATPKAIAGPHKEEAK